MHRFAHCHLDCHPPMQPGLLVHCGSLGYNATWNAANKHMAGSWAIHQASSRLLKSRQPTRALDCPGWEGTHKNRTGVYPGWLEAQASSRPSWTV